MNYKTMTGHERGNWIRQHRCQRLTVEQLGDLFKMSPDWIRDILNGYPAPHGDYWNTGICQLTSPSAIRTRKQEDER